MSKLTAAEHIKKLESEAVKMEKWFDEKILEIKEQIEQIEKAQCPHCEGLGTYNFNDFIDKCPECHGTGFEKDSPEYEPEV